MAKAGIDMAQSAALGRRPYQLGIWRRLLSEPCMTTVPSVVHTHHLHFRPRLFKRTSKIGNRPDIEIATLDFCEALYAPSSSTHAKIMQHKLAFRNYH
jgi:hypothetical protein